MAQAPDPMSIGLAIGLPAMVTYALRAGGLLMADHLPRSGPLERFMRALPGTILLSLVVPGILAAGPAGWIAAGVTAFLARRTGNLFVAMIAGMSIVAVARQF
jgi:uncharacterized membrane protein